MRKALLAVVLLCGPSLAGGESPISETIRIDSLIPVPMRDGARLYADIYRPRREGKFPVLVVRTPYGVQRDGMHETKVQFARRGYAVVVQDVQTGPAHFASLPLKSRLERFLTIPGGTDIIPIEEVVRANRQAFYPDRPVEGAGHERSE